VDEAGEIVKGMMAETQSPPEKARLQAWLGNTYFQAKRYSEAAQVFADVLKNKEATTDAKAKATYEMAICHDMLGHHTIAQNYMTKVTKSFPDTTWAKKARGQLYLWLQSQPNGQDAAGR
jgi:TolA-binding protein